MDHSYPYQGHLLKCFNQAIYWKKNRKKYYFSMIFFQFHDSDPLGTKSLQFRILLCNHHYYNQYF